MSLPRFSAWTLVTLLLSCCSLVAGQCGNGVVESMEQCDDNNTVNADGCNSTCYEEDHFVCTNITSTPSDCVAVLLDLDVNDSTSLNGMDLKYFDINTPVLLVDPSTLDFFVRPAANWTYLDIVILDRGSPISETVGLEYGSNPSPPRPLMLDILSSDYPSGVNGRDVTSGVRVLVEGSSLTVADLNTTLLAVMYQSNEHPGYSPLEVCLIAIDPLYSTTACVTLYFIGYNSNPPSVTYMYEAEDVAQFVEGQSEAVSIIVGNISVQDDDHPTRFLIESASASIVDFREGNEEWLSLNASYILPTGLSAAFDNRTGILTITGSATTDVYSAVLEWITYFNNMSQPDGLSRSVEVAVEDGMHTSMPITIYIDIVNINDNPLVSLNGEVPVIEYTTNYREGTGAVTVVPNLTVLDIDPNPIILRAVVVLSNVMDGDDEVIAVTDLMGLNLTSSGHTLELSGSASPAVYTGALRTVTYHHLSANPGNPSTQDRLLEFTVEDSKNATSVTSILTLNIIPVNDAPLLSFLSGGTEESYTYTEDDPPVYIGQNITLRDVDSPIMDVSLYITNGLDGDQDSFSYDSALVEALSLSVTVWHNGTSSDIQFEGEASAANYTEILRSLTYTNLHTNNSITEGQRSVIITASDNSGSATPQSLTLLIDVAERNDGPAIDLGDGSDAGFTITYIEDGPPVGIGLDHLIQVMDEEGHGISGMDIELVSTNGTLDEGDLLVLRTPMALPFIFDPNTVITNTLISINLLGDSNNYTDALLAVKYVNIEDEPTLFVNGSNLTREIVIRITDATTVPEATTNEVRVTVNIEPINDNSPRIIINSYPECTEDSDDHTVSRRSLPPLAAGSHKRRRRSNTYSDNIAAPQAVEVIPSFTHADNNHTCLSELVVVFNTDTNAPVVEIQKEFDSLLTFAPASLAKTPHYGYWRDYRTLLMVFKECVRWEGQQHSKKPLYVVFYGQDSSCNWESPCNKGICYYNSTGCPVVGYYPAHGPIPQDNTDLSDIQDIDTGHLSYNCHLLAMGSMVLLVAVVTVWVYSCKRGRSRTAAVCINSSVKTSAPATHVIDIHAPSVTKSTPTTSEKHSPGAIEKHSPLVKDEHLPPPYVQGTDLTLTPPTKTTMTDIFENSPSKLPPDKRVSVQEVRRSVEEKKAGKESGYQGGHDGQGEGEWNTGEGKEERVEGVERVLRGDTSSVDGEPAIGSSELQQRWQARERGGVARGQGYYGNDCSRQSREHSHSSQQCNITTPHPH